MSKTWDSNFDSIKGTAPMHITHGRDTLYLYRGKLTHPTSEISIHLGTSSDKAGLWLVTCSSLGQDMFTNSFTNHELALAFDLEHSSLVLEPAMSAKMIQELDPDVGIDKLFARYDDQLLLIDHDNPDNTLSLVITKEVHESVDKMFQ